MLGRRRQQDVALPAITAIELGLCEQRADFRFAAGGQQCQPVERASKRAALDEVRATLAKPAGQLQPRIVIAAHKTEAMPGRAFGRLEGDDRQRPEFAWKFLIRAACFGWAERIGAGGNLAPCLRLRGKARFETASSPGTSPGS